MKAKAVSRIAGDNRPLAEICVMRGRSSPGIELLELRSFHASQGDFEPTKQKGKKRSKSDKRGISFHENFVEQQAFLVSHQSDPLRRGHLVLPLREAAKERRNHLEF